MLVIRVEEGHNGGCDFCIPELTNDVRDVFEIKSLRSTRSIFICIPCFIDLRRIMRTMEPSNYDLDRD